MWLLCAVAVSAAPIDDAFLDRLAHAESRGRAVAGDRGRALGPFQMHAEAWKDVSRLRAGNDLPTYRRTSHEPTQRLYAQHYLEILAVRFERARGRQPSHPELVALWNLGWDGFRRRGFDLKRIPTPTKKLIERMK